MSSYQCIKIRQSYPYNGNPHTLEYSLYVEMGLCLPGPNRLCVTRVWCFVNITSPFVRVLDWCEPGSCLTSTRMFTIVVWLHKHTEAWTKWQTARLNAFSTVKSCWVLSRPQFNCINGSFAYKIKNMPDSLRIFSITNVVAIHNSVYNYGVETYCWLKRLIWVTRNRASKLCITADCMFVSTRPLLMVISRVNLLPLMILPSYIDTP